MHQTDLSKIPADAVVDDMKRTRLGSAKCGICKGGEPSDDAVRVTLRSPDKRRRHDVYDVYVHSEKCFQKLINQVF